MKKANKKVEVKCLGETEIDLKETESLKLNSLKEEDLAIRITDGDIEMDLEKLEYEVVLPLPIYNKLMTYTRVVDDEITGLGLVEKIGKWTFKIVDVYLLDQVVSRAQCEIKTESIVKLMDKLIKEGKNPSMLRLWWHSHNTMGANWSGTDMETGRKFAGSEYLISIVTTHSGEMKARLNIYSPLEIVIDNLPICVSYPTQDNSAILEECQKEVTEKVKKEVFSYNNLGDTVKTFHRESYTEPPYGETFIDKEVRFVWYRREMKYKAFDIATNRELGDKEVIDKVGTDYNNKYNWPNWYQYSEAIDSEIEEAKRLGYHGLGYDY